jgi:penicillin amidase
LAYDRANECPNGGLWLVPGGQSGNPGSKYYDNMIDYWVQGKYYKLWFMQDADRTSSNIKWTMSFSKK